MQLAYVTVSGRGMVDEFISEVVKAFQRDGSRIAGTVRDRPADPFGHPCNMDLRILPDGPASRIRQPLGAGAKGCRLDGGGIEIIAAEVEARLLGADILVINKFGKQEEQGRGLCAAISMALDMGIPTLVGVNEMNVPDFQAFSDGVAESLRPELRAIRA